MKRSIMFFVGLIMLAFFADSVSAIDIQKEKMLTDQKQITAPATKKTDTKIDAKKIPANSGDEATDEKNKNDGRASDSKQQHEKAKNIINNLK